MQDTVALELLGLEIPTGRPLMYKLDKDPGCGQRHATPQGNATSRNLPSCRYRETDPRLPAPTERCQELKPISCDEAIAPLKFGKYLGAFALFRFVYNYPTLFCSSLQACHGLPTFILWVYGCWMFILYLRMFLL